MFNKDNLSEIHNLINILEDSNNFKEANVLHEKFIKLSQTIKQVSHPFDKKEKISVNEGDTGLRIAEKLIDNKMYLGNINQLWERIQQANPVKPERGFLGIPISRGLTLQPGMRLSYPEPTKDERNTYANYLKTRVDVKPPQRPFGRPVRD